MTTITINIDEAIKEGAQKKASKDGLTMTTLIAQFLKSYMENDWELTMVPGTKFWEQHKKALKDIRSGKAKLYTSAEELSQDILGE